MTAAPDACISGRDHRYPGKGRFRGKWCWVCGAPSRLGCQPASPARPTRGLPVTFNPTPRSLVGARRKKHQLAARDGGWGCRYCGTALTVEDSTRDHIVPLSRGGPDTLENQVLACRDCNKTKGSRTPLEAGMPLKDPNRQEAKSA